MTWWVWRRRGTEWCRREDSKDWATEWSRTTPTSPRTRRRTPTETKTQIDISKTSRPTPEKFSAKRRATKVRGEARRDKGDRATWSFLELRPLSTYSWTWSRWREASRSTSFRPNLWCLGRRSRPPSSCAGFPRFAWRDFGLKFQVNYDSHDYTVVYFQKLLKP